MNPLRSEDDFLALIDRHFPPNHPCDHAHLLLGRGDDAAVLRCPDTICMTCDLFLEDIHCRSRYFSAADIGHKSLAVNLSDIAAMGAVPLGFTLSLMAPKRPPEYWDAFFAAMAGLAATHDAALVGGDLSRSPILGVNVTIWGKPAAEGRMLTRAGCRPGDVLFAVCAPGHELGLARIGLAALEAGDGDGTNARKSFPAATAAHLRPEPMVQAGVRLAAEPGVRCLMDISDGIARDLPRLLAQGAVPSMGADLTIPKETLHPEVVEGCWEWNMRPSHAAVLGGEDYGLLGAAAPEAADGLEQRIPGLRRIGVATDSGTMTLDGESFTAAGFDHFGE